MIRLTLFAASLFLILSTIVNAQNTAVKPTARDRDRYTRIFRIARSHDHALKKMEPRLSAMAAACESARHSLDGTPRFYSTVSNDF